jgi:tryptophanyl-tRNA synthetase
MRFDSAYYTQVIDEHRYERVGLDAIDFTLAGMPAADLRTKWMCHTGAHTFAEAVKAGHPAIVTTGIGLGGPPHAGTLFQLLRAVFLQRAGLTVQVVLGDYDSYCARHTPLDTVRRLADRYERFLLRLGFDPQRGILRRQEGAVDVLTTAYLLSRHLHDDDFTWAEEDLADLYRSRGVFDRLDFPMKQATLLMAADFVHLLRDGWHVLVTLGLDEHKYVALARRGAQRWGLPADRLAGIYTKMIPGLGGLPKMSKSLPGSGIDATMTPEAIRATLDADQDTGDEDGSALVQMHACLPRSAGRATTGPSPPDATVAAPGGRCGAISLTA